jgi:hypothetical protein
MKSAKTSAKKTSANSSAATTRSFRLELAGQSLPVNSVEGGAAVGVVVNGPSTTNVFREKHLSGTRFEPIAIEAAFNSARPLFDLVANAWKGTRPQANGALIAADAGGRPVSRREFVKAVVTEATVPTLDGSSRDPAIMTVRLVPQQTSDVAPPMTLPAVPRPPAPSLVSNFRLTIPGLDCTRVAKIDSFTVKPQANVVEFPDLRIELSPVSGATWRDFYRAMVIEGHSTPMDEKTGTIELLSANLTQVVATISLFNLGIFRLDETLPDSTSGQTRLVANLYCERMELAIS